MSPIDKFIARANQLGSQQTPFFFLIDFEQQQPLVFTQNELSTSGLIVDFFSQTKAENYPINKTLKLNFTPINYEVYQAGFELVKKHIQLGNSYLLNLTYPTEISCNYDLSEIFYASQAKYKLLYQDKFVCFSPECFIKIKNNKIYSFPMKGTINADEEEAEFKLLNSEKELREHNTIVDLIRNDLSIVANNIKVNKYRYIEKIKTHRGIILQTSSEICGNLSSQWQNEIGSLLVKLLPAGSISGAPKIKTVEIIQQVEKQPRGYYTGIFGYFDGDSLESAVAIRYIEKQGNKLIFRSGGGITISSHVMEEYQEILDKIYVPISTI